MSRHLIVRLFIAVLVLGIAGLALLAGLVWALPLPEPEIATSSHVLDVHGNLIRELYVERRTPVPLADVPEVLRIAILTTEDERFHLHWGIDPVALVRATIVNWRSGRIVEGGSTISQQLVKNLYLTHDRTYYRKVVEALLTLKMEMRSTKSEILELYMNQIYLGHGAFGVESAAQTYFGKSVTQLDLAESALLAGLIRSPENYSPYNNPALAVTRRNQVLDRLEQRGHIEAGEAQVARNRPIDVAGLPAQRSAPYFIAYLLAQIQQHHPDLAALLHRGGLVIHTSLDRDMQDAAERAVTNRLVAGQADADGILQPQVALVAIEPSTGQIRAMIGGRDYGQTQLNRASQAFRPPGSAFKFFVYTAVTAQGYPPTSLQMCEPVSYPGPQIGTTYSPRNFDGTYAYRPLAVREAISTSNNVVAVRWTHLLGPSLVSEYAHLMGIKSELHDNLSLALGTAEVSPLEITVALAPLANGGLRVETTALLSIADSEGNVLFSQQAQPRPVLDARVSYLVSHLFTSSLAPGGTAAHLRQQLPYPVAGKTGTSTGLLDAWFIGYTPDLAASVWVGWDGQERGLPGTGGVVAGPIWADFMNRALPATPGRTFQAPPGVVELDICAETGLLPNQTCPTRREVFLVENQPRLYDRTVHQSAEDPDAILPEGTEQDAVEEPEQDEQAVANGDD